MITKQEIIELATLSTLQTHVIEKDYVLGWLLAGINQHSMIRDTWVFKGGTCLKKCYFETYRFSEDLDFTLKDPTQINSEFLLNTFNEIAEWVYEQSGIEIPADRMKFEIYKNPRGADSCKGRVFYKGPATFSSKHSMPRIKLDLTADEILVDEPITIPVRHDYSDLPDGGITILSYSYAEVFAEKIRALKERTRPRDLYDVINFYRRPESVEVAKEVRSILVKKCQYKNITFPSLNDLDAHREICAAGWKDQLGHQLQALPPFDAFWGELPTFFDWLESQETAHIDSLMPIPPLYEGEATTIFLEAGIPNFNTLERVRFTAVNRLCVELDYQKENGERLKYVIEPYSLRRTREGNLVLYGVKLPSGQTRCFRTDRIVGATVTQTPFIPRFTIDFIPEGPVRLSARLLNPMARLAPPKTYPTRPPASQSTGAVKYVFRCPSCGKQFRRSTYNPKLNSHKNKNGFACYGGIGVYIKQSY